MYSTDPKCVEDFLNPVNNTLTWYNYSNLLLMTYIIYFTGFFLSSWIVGKYILEPLPSPVKIIKKKYQDKYCLDDMQKDLSRNNEVTKNTSVMDLTPNGNVIMRYNQEREGFEYWCNNQNIKYDYLETVARKFVIMNFCTNLYVDRHKNIKEQHDKLDKKEKEKEEAKKKAEEEAEKKAEEDANEEAKEKEKGGNITEKKALKKELDDDCVFVKSKLSLEKKQKEEIIDRKKVVAKKANKYLYMGKLNEFDWLRKPEIKKNSKSDISFSNFKNLFMNSQ
tara:strand:- start:1517 stop:2353 length:837 start_codon:yes stop_codon:yes gene_type:complete